MFGYLLASIIMRDIYAAKSFHLFSDHHCRNLQTLIGRQTLLRRNRNCDHAVHFPLAQLGENIFLFVQAAVCIADNHTVSFIKCLVFDRFYNFTEKGIGNLRNQQTNDIRPVSCQTLGDEIRFIIQLFDPVEYLLTRLRLDGGIFLPVSSVTSIK